MDSYLNISIQQPSIPTYRRPLFEKLSRKVNLLLLYGFDGVPSDLPDEIIKQYFPLKTLKLSKLTLKWHTAQLAAVNSKSDVAILSWDVQYLSLWFALLKSILLRKKIILWGHGYSKNENKIKRFIRNIPVFLADAVLLYDYHTAEEFKKIKVVKKKIFVAPNSLDQSIITYATRNCLNSISSLDTFKIVNNIEESFNIICIGRIYKDNKMDLLIESFKHLSPQINNIKLIVIGRINKHAIELQKKALILGVADRIIWTDAIYDENIIAPWMLSSHLFCYPANIGLSIMHAFGYSLPVITDNNYKAHNPEIWSFIDKTNGLAYEAGNAEDLAEKILCLYHNSALRLELSKQALLTVINTYNADRMVDGFISAINYVNNR